jgi:hypothetical protein
MSENFMLLDQVPQRMRGASMTEKMRKEDGRV